MMSLEQIKYRRHYFNMTKTFCNLCGELFEWEDRHKHKCKKHSFKKVIKHIDNEYKKAKDLTNKFIFTVKETGSKAHENFEKGLETVKETTAVKDFRRGLKNAGLFMKAKPNKLNPRLF
jgi:hypothetical protein